jgi:hypothetical protein
MVYQHRSRQNEAFEPRRNRPGGLLLAAPSQGWETRLIAQWALPFTPRVPQMSVRKIKDLTSGRVKRTLTMPTVRQATSQEA